MNYAVTWDIEIDADSPEEAARLAREMQTDPTTTATIFDVTDGRGRRTRVDLDSGESTPLTP
jgi:hypothetical protein